MPPMAPFEAPTIFEQLPRYIFKIPRVVADQKGKFETDDLFRKLSREGEIRYTGYRDRPREERQIRFQNGCREGHTDIAFVSNGTNLQLFFAPCPMNAFTSDYCDFTKERGKVHIRSSFIMNGVCVRWRGWIDLERLDGVGCLEFDEHRARIEDAILREQIDCYNQRLKEFEERQKVFQMQAEAELQNQRKLSEAALGASCSSNGPTSSESSASARTPTEEPSPSGASTVPLLPPPPPPSLVMPPPIPTCGNL